MNNKLLCVISGCLVFLCLIVIWEITASIRYENYLEEKTRIRRMINHGDYVSEEYKSDEEIRKELMELGNPYSLFR